MNTDQTKTVTYDCELTDTFGGDANYAWVRRKRIDVPADASDRTVVRRAKAALGMTGMRCKTHSYGDMIELRPQGECTVAFITFVDETA